MQSAEKVRGILVVDTDLAFLDSLKSDPANHQYPVKTATNGQQAQQALADKEQLLAGIFVSPSVADHFSWISILRCASMNRPATPLYVLLGGRGSAQEIAQLDLRKLGVKKAIERPSSYADMVKLVDPIVLSPDAQAALDRAKREPARLDAEETGEDASFLGIRAEDFLSGTRPFFDVYVRLPSGRYLKLLQAGDAFTPDRIESYLLKGTTHFYIKKEAQELYVEHCDHIASALIHHKTAPMEVKVNQTLNHGEETLKNLKANGFSEANLRYAVKFVSNVRELTSQMNMQGGSLFRGFMASVAAYEHGIGTAMLAGVLANSLGISQDKPAQVVGLAAMFHDLALAQMPEALWDEDESRMTAEQIRLYRTHPQLAALELSRIHGLESAAIQAVEQHHMRLSGKGFPARSGTTLVARVSEIVGICDELNRVIRKTDQHPSMNLFTELESKIFPLFGQPLVGAVKAVFYPNQYGHS